MQKMKTDSLAGLVKMVERLGATPAQKRLHSTVQSFRVPVNHARELEAEVTQSRLVFGTAPERPVILAI
jgi:hypothetical protein